MVRPSDVVVLLALLHADCDWTLRSVGDALGVKHSKVQRAIERLQRAGLYDPRPRRIVPHRAEEFLLHALKYLDPLEEGPPARGVPTAWAAAPLRDEIAPPDDLPPVWPDPHGDVRGLSVRPLDPVLPRLAAAWPEVAEMAALLDALRLGDTRSRRAAELHLSTRLAARA